MLLFSHCQLNIKRFIAADMFAKYVFPGIILFILAFTISCAQPWSISIDSKHLASVSC